jgi:NADH:ubiquinone oxidoreductase subunit F (NADH-binding)
VAGDVEREGVWELPIGTTLRDYLRRPAGGGLRYLPLTEAIVVAFDELLPVRESEPGANS